VFRSIAIALTLCLATDTAQAALLGRAGLTPGGTDYQAYYDDILDVTWSLPMSVGSNASSGDGLQWAGNFSLAGVDDWYLASVEQLRHMRNVNGIYPDRPNVFSEQPMCELYWNLQRCLPNSGQFYTADMIGQFDSYGLPISYPLRYSFQNDSTFYFGDGYAGWAVSNGDVLAPVPIPAAVWLFGSALGVMGWMRRKICS
jgi:hypothetical protein